MNQSKEFQGRSLDEAIQEACDFYGVPREKLEIEILSDAKSGIFGLVGAKKASIRASKVQLSGTVSALLEEDAAPSSASPARGGGRRQQGRAGRPAQEDEGVRLAQDAGVRLSQDANVRLAQDASGRLPKDERVHGGDRTAKNERVRPAKDEPARPSTEQAAKNGAAVRDASSGPLENAPAQRDSGGRKQRSGRTGSSSFAPASAGEGKASPELAPADGFFEAPAAGEPSSKSGSGRGQAFVASPKRGAGPRPDARERGRGAARNDSARNDSARTDSARNDFSRPDADPDEVRDDLPEFSLEDCDRDVLFALVREVVLTLVAPIVGAVPCTVELAGKRVRASLDCGEASGLLVGRDGQTLASVQYLAARIVSRKLGGSVRLQIDAGKYRERQDDKLREQALALAAKVRETGKPQSTRPLSAYQRRIVHLALEHEEAVTTRSKGEGAQRRVVIYLSRGGASAESEASELPESPESPDFS